MEPKKGMRGAWAALPLLLGACSGGGTTLEGNLPDQPDHAVPADSGAAHFAVTVCAAHGGTPGYTYDELVERYAACSPDAGYFTFRERDVERYVVPRTPDGGVELELTAEAAAAVRARAGDRDVGWVFGEDPFEVSLDRERQYLGLTYFVGGAAALRFPVLHVVEEAGRVWLRIGDYQGRWAGWGPFEPTAESRVDTPALRSFFRGLGRLVER